MNPFVFLVGCHRSGTTLLHRMVDAHPRIALIHETRWIVPYFKSRTGLTAGGTVAPEMIGALIDHKRFRELDLGRKELESLLDSREPFTYAGFVSRVFDLYGEREGKRLVGDKTPFYVREIPTLHALWPEARFVHVIRDGRDVCLSILSWKRDKELSVSCTTWREEPLATAALWWEWHVRLGREAGTALGPGLYHEVRYESLVERPAETCESVCTFLDQPFDEAMLRFHEGRTRSEPGLDAKQAWMPVTRGLRDWRSQMSAMDVTWVEATAGDLLEELGYARAVPDPHVDSVEVAEAIRGRFALDVAREGHPVPARWCSEVAT